MDSAERITRLEERVAANLTEFHLSLAYAKESRDKNEATVDRRLTAMNEFRLALSDQTSRYVDREYFAAQFDNLTAQMQRLQQDRNHFVTLQQYQERHQAVEERVNVIEKWQANLMGRAVAIGILGAIFVAAITGLIYHLVL